MSGILRRLMLLFILCSGNAICHSVQAPKPTYSNNRIHQSVNWVDISADNINDIKILADSMQAARPEVIDEMRGSIKNTRIIENESPGLESSSAFEASTTLQLTGNEVFECGSIENLHKGQFTVYDYAIVCGMLGISLGIGVFYGFFHQSSSESSSSNFLLGSGMTVLPVTLSLTTSFITAIELLGNPSEMFYQGTQFAFIVLPMLLVIPVAIKVFYPIYFRLELTSCYEYLGIRFGRDIRMLGAFLYIIQMSFYTAVAVLAPAIAVSKATGLNTRLAVVLIYLVCIFYSSQGGMKAVVIADTFQACVLGASLILIVILGHFYTGGWRTVYETASANDRLEFFNFNVNPTTRHTVWSVVIGGFFYWTSLFCTNQASVQKCMSLKSMKLARVALYFAILGLILVFLINFHTGLIVYTQYSSCDPLGFGRIAAKDQLLPFYVMDVFKEINFVTGIFVAGIFAASLGTVASALNSLSAVTCEDLLENGFNIKIHPNTGATYAKWMSLGYGIFSFLLVFVVERLGGVLQATLTLNGLVGGVTLGLFILGIAFKKANAKGAFYGGITALVLVVYIGVMAQISNVEPKPLPLSTAECNCVSNITTIIPNMEEGGNSLQGVLLQENGISSIFRLSYMWYSMIGTVLTIILGLLISVISDIVTKRRVLEITKKRNEAENSQPVNGITIVVGQQRRQLPELGKSQHPMETLEKPSPCGVDNMALKVDDEK
ncbi:unnamed protein product [Hermetia illucens]|uniref:Sodium-coupled monocarboxylate transporter 1 n=1 Tax=Hermetia illucens TaxID=343691 RepID=A0A7R8UKS0_HERIL|nr:sodium-coupled monocarboxylate transporter 1 [Hermetia illucens]CAD7081832.1 unnamed protein product [Hermetia illucens]